jgi:hypothetical protein
MASTTFIDGTTVIRASWLNDVNATVYNGTFPNNSITFSTAVWGGYSITAPTGSTTTFLRNDGTWAAPPGGASATLQQVIQNGNTSTNNASIGGVGIGNQINAPTGLTVYGITSTANYVGIQSNFGGSTPYTALLSGAGFIPYPDNTLALGASPYRWASLSVGTGNFNWNNINISAPTSGTTTGFLRQDGAWSNILTGNASFGGVGIGNQLNAPTGTTVYGITSTANYVGIQSNFGGSTPYTVLLSGAAFLPYSNGSSSNSGIALGAPASLWSSLGVAGTFYWSNATITAPNTSTGDATKFLNQQGSWVVPSGTGTGLTSVGLSMPTGFSVSGSPLTSNGTLSVSWSGYVPTANLGSGTASSSTYLRGDGTWATVTAATPTLQQVATAGSTYSGGITTTTNSQFGGVGVGVSSSGPAGTTYGIGASASTIGIGNNTTQVYLYNSSFIPATNNSLTLGSSSYQWSSFYLASTFNWGSYGISAPAGNSSTFLNNNGQWTTPTGTVPSLASVCAVGNSYSGGLAITGSSSFGSASTFANTVELYTQTTASSTNALGAYVAGSTSNAIAAVVASTGSNLAFFGYGSPSSITQVGTITTNGTATVYGTASDRRLKSNIATLTSGEGIAKIKKLTPRSFTWNSSNEADVGFIADELQTVIPNAVAGAANAVDENGKPLYQSVDSSMAIVYLVQAVQELIAKAGL